jgi:hypothetical protein
MPTPAEEKALRLQKKKEQLKLSEIANKEKGEQLAEQGFAPNEQVSRARRRRRKEGFPFTYLWHFGLRL